MVWIQMQAKLFADDTSLFSVVHDTTDAGNLLNSNLSKINEYALHWKMDFNPDPKKQGQEKSSAKRQRKIAQALCLVLT